MFSRVPATTAVLVPAAFFTSPSSLVKMSKTPKSKTPNNTLFSYFHKTPTEKRDSALKAATAATAAADDHDRRRRSPAEAKKTPPSSDRAPKRKSNAKDDSDNGRLYNAMI